MPLGTRRFGRSVKALQILLGNFEDLIIIESCRESMKVENYFEFIQIERTLQHIKSGSVAGEYKIVYDQKTSWGI